MIDDLPLDILYKIHDNLDPISKIRLRCVNLKLHKKIMQNDPNVFIIHDRKELETLNAYLYDNYCICVHTLIDISIDNDIPFILEFILEYELIDLNILDSIITLYISNDAIQCLKYLIHNYPDLIISYSDFTFYCFKAVECKSLSCFQYIYEKYKSFKCDNFNDNLIFKCVKYGFLHGLKYLKEQGFIFKAIMVNLAITHNNLEIIDYLFSIGCPHYDDIFQLAMRYSNINIIKFLYNENINKDNPRLLLINACLASSSVKVAFLYENGFITNDLNPCRIASEYGLKPILLQLESYGFTMRRNELFYDISMYSKECIDYAKKKKLNWKIIREM
jgi:hypothetical protein